MSSLPWPELYENQMQKITQKTNNFKQVQSRQLIKPTKWKNYQETIQALKTTVSMNPEAGLVLMHSRVSCTWGELRDGAATGPPAEEKRIF
jgi:hypothetical protein